MEKPELKSNENERAAAINRGSCVSRAKSTNAKRDPYLRAANEDDDGYDPYSDRPYVEPFYEPDPWN